MAMVEQVQPGVIGKDYSEYWKIQILTVKALQISGVKIGAKDRIPIFRLWRIISNRMIGKKGDYLLQLLNRLAELRRGGLEPPHKDGKYL